MLWNSIYQFFVQHIFGGVIWNAEGNIQYPTAFGGVLGNAVFYNTSEVEISLFGVRLSLGNYLSLIATAITIIIILILCCLFIKKIISLMSKLFSGGTL